MPDVYIPDWIKAADPAAQWARGYPQGLQVAELQNRAEEGARRAQQVAMELELQRERMRIAGDEAQQRTELEEKYLTQRAKVAADKASAIMEYQQAIQDGMDPIKAILKYGPAMGQSGAEAAAIRTQYQAEALKQKQDHYGDVMQLKQDMQQRLFDQQVKLKEMGLDARAGSQGDRLTPEDREQIRSDRRIIIDFEKEWGGMMGQKMKAADPKGYAEALRQVQDAASDILEYRPTDPIARRFAGEPASGAGSAGGATISWVRDASGKLVPAGGQTRTDIQPGSPSLAPTIPRMTPPVPAPNPTGIPFGGQLSIPKPTVPSQEWPQEEIPSDAPSPPTSTPKVPGGLKSGIGSLLQNPVGKAVADALEGFAGMQDLGNISATDYTGMVKSLRKTFEDAVKPSVTTEEDLDQLTDE